MKLLFWNINKKNHPGIKKSLIEERALDEMVFSEHKNLNKEYLIQRLEAYELINPPGSDKIVFIVKKDLFSKPVVGQNRYAAIVVNETNYQNAKSTYLIMGVHLAAMASGEAIRDDSSRDIMADVNRLETERKIDRTILIGDFNETPFDNDMIRHTNFNAVLFKDLIDQKRNCDLEREEVQEIL